MLVDGRGSLVVLYITLMYIGSCVCGDFLAIRMWGVFYGVWGDGQDCVDIVVFVVQGVFGVVVRDYD